MSDSCIFNANLLYLLHQGVNKVRLICLISNIEFAMFLLRGQWCSWPEFATNQILMCKVIFLGCLWLQLYWDNAFALSGLFYFSWLFVKVWIKCTLTAGGREAIRPASGMLYFTLYWRHQGLSGWCTWSGFDGCESLPHHKWQLPWQSAVTYEGMSLYISWK